jgi:tyrosine-protein kinase Etk/Wzc
MPTSDISLLDVIVALLKRKKILIVHFICAAVISVAISLAIPKSFKSSITFIPPGQSSSSILSMLGDNLGADMLGGSNLSKRQYLTLLDSRELREDLIAKFDLLKVYKLDKRKNGLDLTLKALKKIIEIKETEEGGLGITDVVSVSVSVIDKKPQRASDMANYLFALLEKKALSLNQNEYSHLIAFLAQQISASDSLLEKARLALTNFQTANKMYDVSSQASITAHTVGELEASKMTLELQKSYLENNYLSQFSQIKSINEKISVISRKISDLEKQYNVDIIPGLQQSLDLTYQYLDLAKNVETYAQVSFLLSQQLQMAQLKLKKDYTGIYLVDKARPAQYKYKPKRAIVVLLLVFVYMTSVMVTFLLQDYYAYMKTSHPEQLLKIQNALKG